MNPSLQRTQRNRTRMVFSVSILLLTLCCTQKNPIELPTYQAPVLWSEPIEAYLQLGQEKFGDDFDKSIGTLKVFDEKLWFGYGDTRVNMGSYIPIEFRYFENPSEAQPLSAKVRGVKQGAPQRNPFDTGEERIVPFKEFEGKLCKRAMTPTMLTNFGPNPFPMKRN